MLNRLPDQPRVLTGIIPGQIFPAFGCPVRQHPAFDMNTVDDMVVRRGAVGMAVDKCCVTVAARFIFDGCDIDVGDGLCLRAVTAALTAPEQSAGDESTQPVGQAQ